MSVRHPNESCLPLKVKDSKDGLFRSTCGSTKPCESTNYGYKCVHIYIYIYILFMLRTSQYPVSNWGQKHMPWEDDDSSEQNKTYLHHFLLFTAEELQKQYA